MTRKQYRQKVSELIGVTIVDMRNAAERLLHSGAFDLPSATDDYQVPKAVMTAICRQQALTWRPLTEEGRALAHNLELFL